MTQEDQSFLRGGSQDEEGDASRVSPARYMSVGLLAPHRRTSLLKKCAALGRCAHRFGAVGPKGSVHRGLDYLEALVLRIDQCSAPER
jgi:hypothetical protein